MSKLVKFVVHGGLALCCFLQQGLSQRMAFADAPRPKLQFINGSQNEMEVFWLNAENERISNGTVASGRNRIIDTTLGHQFVIVGVDGEGNKKEVQVESRVSVQGIRFDPDSPDGIPGFYSQVAYVEKFPIVASKRVSPFALMEAQFLVQKMLDARPDILEALARSGARLCIMAHDEFTTDLPEFVWLGRSPNREFPELDPKDYWDARARGTGGSPTDPFCSCAEENLLGYPGDPYAAECILIHEFAHCIHLRGMTNVDPTFDTRLKATYEQAMKKGLWKGKYASVNHHEYFAEGVQSWFDDNRENDHDHNHVNTRKELQDYDSELAAMCSEVFGETEIQYSKPVTRLSGHMEGYDPQTAPTFVWPARLKNAQTAIREHAVARDRAANAKAAKTKPVEPPPKQIAPAQASHEIREIVGWTVHVHRDLLKSDSKQLTEQALTLLAMQLEEIVRELPPAAVSKLRTVPLWFSPEYSKTRPGAEYHPNADWLRKHGRDPQMARCVEFTNVRNFESESRRMPNFALHELAHAYHDQFLPKAFRNPKLKAAYERAKSSGTYDRVERRDAEGNTRMDRAYALTNPQEYFAETTEAYFSRNDFFPYDRQELQRHDPEVCKLLAELWGQTSD